MQKQQEQDFEDADGKLHVYCTQHPAIQGFKLMQRLGKVMGPMMATLKGVTLKDDVSAAAPALGALFGTLTPDEFEELAKDLLRNCMVLVHGQKPMNLTSSDNIDIVFSGRMITMLKVMMFAVKVNFSDFFAALGKAKAEASSPGEPSASEPASASTSQST